MLIKYKSCEIELEKEKFSNKKFWLGYVTDLNNNLEIDTIEEDASLKWFEVLQIAKDIVDKYEKNPDQYLKDKSNSLKKVIGCLEEYSKAE